MEREFLCSLCPSERINRVKFSLKQYLQHLRLFHAHQPRFHLTCGIQGCQRTFSKFRTFENHVSSMHRAQQHPTDEQDILPSNDLDNSISTSIHTDNDETSCSSDLQPTVMNLQRSSALMLLKLKEVHK